MKRIKEISYALIFFNLVSIIFGIIYLLTPYTVMWDIAGIIYLIALFGNLLLVFLNSIKLNKQSKIGGRLNVWGYIFLIFVIFAMGGMLLGNFLYSVTYPPDLGANLGTFTIIYLSYFGLLVFGLFFAYLNIKHIKSAEVWEPRKGKSGLIRNLIKVFAALICGLLLFVGIDLALLTLFEAVSSFGSINATLGMFAAQMDLFLVFVTLSITIILLKIIDIQRSRHAFYAVGIVGLVISGILMGPLVVTPYSINSADESFTVAFGSNWRDNIPNNIENQFFLKTQFSIPEYFLGMVSNQYRVNANIQFYDAEGIQLYFDVYMPIVDGSTLPGNNSVMIRIHGGGWTAGDKGLANMMQMNKYFAAQGYVVFDIQYGLHDEGDQILPTPDYVRGNFSVDDMVRHIGNFTKYLALHASEFNANLDLVFVSGGSAGGHLACAVGLGIASGNYTSIFGDNLTIKGLIPFYPGNGHPTRFGGSVELINPDDYLVNASSPPCLIFQGIEDGIVHWSITQDLKDAYTASGNDKCAAIYLLLGGHASDLYFSGYYNQVFLYYMERFLYLCVNDHI